MFLACFSVKQKGSSSNVPFKNSYGTVMVAVVEKPGLSSTVGRCNRNFKRLDPKSTAGWWFGNVWNTFLLFDSVGNFMIPTDEVTKSYFFQRASKHQPDWFIMVYHHFPYSLFDT